MNLHGISQALQLWPLHKLSREQQLRVLAIRNQLEIRQNMYTCHEIPEAEHFAWIARLAEDRSTEFFAVALGNEIVGGVSLNAISPKNARADWAYYIDEKRHGHGLGAALEHRFLDYVFDRSFRKLNCEVFVFNQSVISLHRKFGFQDEGVRRAHILRDGTPLDVQLMGITDVEWVNQRAQLAMRLFSSESSHAGARTNP